MLGFGQGCPSDQTGSFFVLKEFLESPVAANALRRQFLERKRRRANLGGVRSRPARFGSLKGRVGEVRAWWLIVRAHRAGLDFQGVGRRWV